MSEKIRLSMSGNHPTEIEPDAVIGAFALHRSVTGEGWTITHVTTGKKVWLTTSLTYAIRAARFLDEGRFIPDGAVEAEAWVTKLTAADKAVMIETLQSIAPRSTPELT